MSMLHVQWRDEDGDYLAVQPCYPTVSAFGETMSAAIREYFAAYQLAREACTEDGTLAAPPRVTAILTRGQRGHSSHADP
jgi:predicted RNase H-like HicB family nuclease